MTFASSDTKDNVFSGEKILPEELGCWKVIISDDEEQVHKITQLALSHFTFEGKELKFFSAYSAEETIQLITQNPDTAIILQDVVMETDNAGLDVVKYVREVLNNDYVRIILRTGQPGQAPERQVIVEYDINDYKEKTELTSQKLFTLMYASLRSYRDILTIDHNKNGLQKIIDSTAEIFSRQSLGKFLYSILEQLTYLINKEHEPLNSDINRMIVAKEDARLEIIAAIGKYSEYITKDANTVMEQNDIDALNQCLISKTNLYLPDCFVAYFTSHAGDERLIYYKGNFTLPETERYLINLYVKQISISFDNFMLYRKVEMGQQEIVNMLGTSIETRSKETGNHIKRVAEFSSMLARSIEMDEDEAETLKLASPLHDFGKIGIPDSILNKPGKLDAEEWRIMKTHSQIGYDMLVNSDCEILKAGAIISHEHHEKWDGSGYPHGKAGEEIHIYGRITAVADVFDALASKRCYKDPWPMEDILTYFKEQRGKHFEPRLVDFLLGNIEKFKLILEIYKD